VQSYEKLIKSKQVRSQFFVLYISRQPLVNERLTVTNAFQTV